MKVKELIAELQEHDQELNVDVSWARLRAGGSLHGDPAPRRLEEVMYNEITLYLF